MLFADVAAASSAVAEESSRKAKTAILARLFGALEPAEIKPVIAWLAGRLTQRQIGVGWAALRDHAPVPAANASLSITAVEMTFDAIGSTSGPGSKQQRADLLRGLFEAATAAEQSYLRRLLGGEVRQGALAALVLDAIAGAADVPIALLRRAAMLLGDLSEVGQLALLEGSAGLAAVRLAVGRAVEPMLAKPATSIADAIEQLGESAWEEKLDGARIQVHRSGDDVAIFTRTLDDVTTRLPEIVELARGLSAESVVLDGEALLLRADGRPEPFQVTAARFGSRSAAPSGRITPYFFDILHRDGRDLMELPGRERAAELEAVVPAAYRARRIVTADPDDAAEFFRTVLASGHEGVVAKSLDAPYEAGRRGGAWLKVKPVHTLDLVVLAVEHGSGRRQGTLSNIHLGALDPATGGYVMLGKTFKGMTDAMLAWQTKRFSELATGPSDGWVVRLRPEQVVEIAFDAVQRSSRYPGGVALRFARVLRYRDDKPLGDIDTIDTVRALLP